MKKCDCKLKPDIMPLGFIITGKAYFMSREEFDKEFNNICCEPLNLSFKDENGKPITRLKVKLTMDLSNE